MACFNSIFFFFLLQPPFSPNHTHIHTHLFSLVAFLKNYDVVLPISHCQIPAMYCFNMAREGYLMWIPLYLVTLYLCLPDTLNNTGGRLVEPYLLKKGAFKTLFLCPNFYPLSNFKWIFSFPLSTTLHFSWLCAGEQLLFSPRRGWGRFPWRWWWLCSDVDTSNVPTAFVISSIRSMWSS